MKKNKILIGILLLISILILTIPVKAAGEIAPGKDVDDIFSAGEDFIDRGEVGDISFVDSETMETAKQVISVLSTVAIVILIIVTLIIGIKYMLATPNDRAKLKKQLIGLLISAMVIFLAYQIWSFSVKALQDTSLSTGSQKDEEEQEEEEQEEEQLENEEQGNQSQTDDTSESEDTTESDDTLGESEEETDEELEDNDTGTDNEVAEYEFEGKNMKRVWEYSSDTIKVSIDSFTFKTIIKSAYDNDAKPATCYLTKIWVKNPGEQIKQISSQNSFKTPATFAKSTKDAVILANVDCTSGGRHDLLIKNEKIVRNNIKNKNRVQGIGLTSTGLKAYYQANGKDVLKDNLKATFRMWHLSGKGQLGYNMMLVYNGQKTKGSIQQKVRSARSILAKIDNNNYFLLTVKGYTGNSAKKAGAGLRLPQCQKLLLEIGCEWAFNFDGGGSTSLCYTDPAKTFTKNKFLGQNWTGRKISDMIYFTK